MTDIVTVPLETPLARGETMLAELKLRRPVSGDLRGISVAKLGQLDYDELRKLLPRIAIDGLIVDEIDRIDTADMVEIGGAIADFLFTKKRQEEFRTM